LDKKLHCSTQILGRDKTSVELSLCFLACSHHHVAYYRSSKDMSLKTGITQFFRDFLCFTCVKLLKIFIAPILIEATVDKQKSSVGLSLGFTH